MLPAARIATVLSVLLLVPFGSGCSGEPDGAPCADITDCPCYHCVCNGASDSYSQGCKDNGTCAAGQSSCSSSCKLNGGSLASFSEVDAVQCEE